MENYNRIHAPWGIFLAGHPTPERVEVEARHGPIIEAAIEMLSAAYRDLMFELMERIWEIGDETTVTREAVIENGFDPGAPEPDLDRYPYL